MSNDQSESDFLLKQRNDKEAELSQSLINSEKSLQILNEDVSKNESTISELISSLKSKEHTSKLIKFIKNWLEKRKILKEIQQREKHINDSKCKANICIKEINVLKEQTEKIQGEISFILSQREKGLELFEAQWVKKLDILRLKEIRIGLSNNFSHLSGHDFEHFVARLLQEMGYTTEVTKKTGDYGVDIIAKKEHKIIAVQCKRYAETNSVGNQDIQRCLGSMHKINAKKSIFVTTSHYTKQALQQAVDAPIELWDKNTLHDYVKKYLLCKDIKEIIDPIESSKIKEKEKREQAEQEIIRKKEELIRKREERKRKLAEKLELEHKKTICPRCHKRKMKNHKYCSRCKAERRRERRDRYDW